MQNGSYQMNRRVNGSISLSQIRQVFNDWVRKLHPIGQEPKYLPQGNREMESSNPETANSDAEFLGWQKTRSGEVFALYNVTAVKHPLCHSTVSERTLRRENLEIPPTPLPQGGVKRFDHEK